MKKDLAYIFVPLMVIAGFYLFGFLTQFMNVYTIPTGTVMVFTFLPHVVLGYVTKEFKHIVKVNLVSSFLLSVFIGFIINGIGTGFEESIASAGYDIGLIVMTSAFFYIPIFLLGTSATILGSLIHHMFQRIVLSGKPSMKTASQKRKKHTEAT